MAVFNNMSVLVFFCMMRMVVLFAPAEPFYTSCQEVSAVGTIRVSIYEADKQSFIDPDPNKYSDGLGLAAGKTRLQFNATVSSPIPPNEYFKLMVGPRRDGANGREWIIQLTKPIDRDGSKPDALDDRNVLEFRLQCRDLPTNVTYFLLLRVQIIDVNDNAPVFLFTPYSVHVNELAPINTTIFRGISATDLDYGVNKEIQFDIQPDPGNLFDGSDKFVIDKQGIVTVRGTLDFEDLFATGKTTYTLQIRASDQAPPASRQTSLTTLNITITDGDDLRPVFEYQSCVKDRYGKCFNPSYTTSFLPNADRALEMYPLPSNHPATPIRIQARDQDTLKYPVYFTIDMTDPVGYESHFHVSTSQVPVSSIYTAQLFVFRPFSQDQIWNFIQDQIKDLKIVLRAEEVSVNRRYERAIVYAKVINSTFQTTTASINGVTVCSAHAYTSTDQSFFISQTAVGGTFYTDELCDIDKRSMGTIRCHQDFVGTVYWGQFVLNKACNFSDLPDSAISDTLRNLSLVKVNRTSIDDVLHAVINITRGTTLTQLDLLYIATILGKTNDLSGISFQVVNRALLIYDYVLSSSKDVLVKAQERGKVANRILKTMDTITDKVSLVQTNNARIVTGTFGTEVWDLTKENVTSFPIGLQLKDDPKQMKLRNQSLKSLFRNRTLDYSHTDAAIVFRSEFLQKVVKDVRGSNIRLVMNVYQDPRLFSISQNTTHLTNYTLNSKVISAKILVDGRPITDLNGTDVTLVFLPEKIYSKEDRSTLTACGYWNFTGNDDTGSWSTDGCRYAREEDGRDVCVCDHLTNFAVLFDFYGQSAHVLSLSIITIVGLSLSIFGLSITVLSFLLFRKLRQSHPQQTLFNLALAELCSWIVFLAGINQTQNHVGCIAVAALLHYFILASFMWMLAEAVLHYRLFVKVLGTYTSRYMLKTGIPAWVIPLFPVVVVLVLDTELYRGGEKYCWMSLTPFYYAFALPVGLVILCNIVLYVMVVISICRRSNINVQSTESQTDRTLMNIRVSVFCFVLLGLSWIFGFLAISDARVVFQYIFCITNSIQGFLIFIFFTLRNRYVRQSWRALCCGQQEGIARKREPKSSNIPLNKSSSDLPQSSIDTKQTGFTNQVYAASRSSD